MDIVKKIEQAGTKVDGKPSQIVKIIGCGETSESKSEYSVDAEKGKVWYTTILGTETIKKSLCIWIKLLVVRFVLGKENKLVKALLSDDKLN